MFQKGAIIEASFWNEPLEVIASETFGSYIKIVGKGLYSKNLFERIISQEDLSRIKIKDLDYDFKANPEETFLAVEAHRFSFASLFDPLLAMHVSKIDPLPFQIEAVYGYVLKLPKIRFLIADDPGAGKTVMAGLIIKELKLRGIAQKILIVVPGHLKDQWIRELKEKFHETFVEVNRHTIKAHYGTNVWEKEKQVITSIDFAKQEDILSGLSAVEWDLVIVDEAHKLSAYKYGDKTQKTDRYKLGEVLSKRTRHLLFLTATPHKGDPENFRLFLDLLEPGFFATKDLLSESISTGDNPLFIRRLKEDLRDFEGKPIFTNRYAKTISYTLSDPEKELYNELSRYVINQYNKAQELETTRNIGFALVILQRRLASSTYALLQSLKRRKKRLEALLKEKELETKSPFLSIEELEEIEDYEEKERELKEKEWETLTLSRTKEELKKEIQTIDSLIQKAEKVLSVGEEVKLKELRKALEEGFQKIREINGNKKILIFTESRDTLEYLVSKMRAWGYKVNYIHGGMSLRERIDAEKIFKHQTQVMVATDAAGEGINLQFCHIMINYDLPWNPVRLEQRLGRIHRYGQKKDVYMFNLVAVDTREGEVLNKILKKLDEIREALGSDRVFDVIGELFYGKNLYQLILEAVVNAKKLDEILAELDIKVDENYITQIKEALGESLATKHIDYTRIKEMAEKAKEHRLIPEYVEEFFKRAFIKAGGKIKIRKDGLIAIEKVPSEIKLIAKDEKFKNTYGSLCSSYSKITFDKEVANNFPDVEFVSFGHPLLEATLLWVKEQFKDHLKRGTIFEDPDGKYNGFIYFFEVEVRDGKGEIAGKKIFALYDNGNEKIEVNPSIIWDLVPAKSQTSVELNFNKDKIVSEVLPMVEKYKEELLAERKRQAEIKEKYGKASLEHLIRELDYELTLLYERKMKGEKVELPILNKEEKLREYQRALKNLEEEIKLETSLSFSMPELLTVIYVIPSSPDTMISDEEIEKIGMEVAMAYEKAQGRIPEDVSKENLGFDIKSRGKDGELRYIEVKARRETGEVALTMNEWFKAKRFKNQYWLYIVENAISNPTLYIINNPAEKSESS